MPTISIFIRNGDLPKWKALENKSEWMHTMLSEGLSESPVAETAPMVPEEEEERSIESQLDDFGLEYVRPGVAWSGDRECEVAYAVYDGKVRVG